MEDFGIAKIYIVVDYGEVDKLINKYYPDLDGGFEVVAAEELSNDIQKEFDLDGEVDEWDRKEIDEGKWQYNTRAYLNDLVARGVIAKGTYLMDVCW